MAEKELAILKLGGSVITFKERPLSTNLKAINQLSRALSTLGAPLIMVQGGGSYGHYLAKRYGLSREPHEVSPEGISKTRAAMLELNLLILKSLERHGLHPYSVPPSLFVEDERLIRSRRQFFDSLIRSGLMPFTFGDVLPTKGGSYVLSGDMIVNILAGLLRPRRVVFSISVDGIYASLDRPESLIREIDVEEPPKVEFSEGGFDVTGGMLLKMNMALRVARMGIDVYFVNGFKPEEVVKALKGERAEGTLIKGLKDEGRK